MDTLNANEVVAMVRRLRLLQPGVFGAVGHSFVLNPPAPIPDVVDFERRHGIELPGAYREFLTAVGNGGAGPYYGIFPLGQMDGTSAQLQTWRSGDGVVGMPSEPFLLRESWNDLAGMPDETLANVDKNEHQRLVDAFDAEYWNPFRMNGCIPICHMGCALRIWLVVVDEDAGHLWYDGRADYTGLKPVQLKNGSPATFGAWYMEWLEDAVLAAGEGGETAKARRS
jgi:hypothetical protein